MGARYQATAVRRTSLRDVRECVDGWLARRGFEVSLAPPLLAVDSARERGAYFFSNADWTIVVYSEPDEEKRLVQELSALPQPLLHVWLVHSDVWGYVLRRDGRTIAEFDSNPDYLHVGSGEPFLDEPQVGDLAAGAPDALRRVLQIDLSVRDLAALQRRRAIFKEAAVNAFCRRLGIGPAATTFAYLEQGACEEDVFKGWDVTCVRYEKAPLPIDGVDVHSAAAFAAAEPAVPSHRPRWGRGQAAAVPFEVPAALRVLSAAMRVVLFPLYMLGLLVRAVWAVADALGLRPKPALQRPVRLPGHPRPPRSDDGWLVNDTHGCRVRLPQGAEAIDPGVVWGSGDVWSVFAVRLDPETVVACEAHGLDALRQISPHGTAIEDEHVHVNAFKARRRVLELRSAERLLQRELYVIQMPRALYVWELRDLRDADRRARFRRLVESFDSWPPSTPDQAGRIGLSSGA